MRLRSLFVLLLLAGAVRADAAALGEQTTFLATAALNGSAASLTFTINNPNGAYTYANLELVRTRVAGSDLTMTCKSTTNGISSAPTATRGVCTYDASGVCTQLTATRKSSTSVTETLPWTVNILGWTRTDCTVASTGAGVTDTIAVTGRMVTR